jgi:hypothetical protein
VTNASLTLITAVGAPVGGPKYEVVPYGGRKEKNEAAANTWDSSDEDEVDSSASEDFVVPKVSAALLRHLALPTSTSSPVPQQHVLECFNTMRFSIC